MRFYFDLDLERDLDMDMSEFGSCSASFPEIIKEAAINAIVDHIMMNYDVEAIKQMVSMMLNEKSKDICEKIENRVVNEVTQKIERKREIAALTPKVSDLAKINKENEQYFMELIDKAIAKKFK